jgi:long-chain acyl-CoA synthetase
MLISEHPPAEMSIALSDLSRQRSWVEMQRHIEQLSRFLAEVAELQPGDGIALLMGNRVEFVECMWAGLVSGLWVTPVNTHLVAAEIAHIIADAGVKLVFCDPAHAPLLDRSGAFQCICIEAQWPVWSALPARPIDQDAPAGGTMLYTSGTTGRPKGVRRHKPDTVRDLLALFRETGLRFGLDGAGAHLITGPLYHAAPMLFGLYDQSNGAPLFILPRWDEQTFLDTLVRFPVSHTHLVPTMFVRLLRRVPVAQRRAFADLSLVLHGAAPVAPLVKRQMIAWWGELLVEYWGGTEGGVATLVDSRQWLRKPGTVGKPLPHLRVFAADEQLRPLPANGVGLLYCQHSTLDQVFYYHQDAEKTRQAHPRPGLFCIGDVGYVDDEGFVFLSDRLANMIISGGVNIYPAEIEHVLIEHPAIVDAAVFGRPDPEWGENVIAAVQVAETCVADAALADEITHFAKLHLAAFKVPKRIEFIACLPRTATGKLLLGQLKAGS